MNYYCDVRPKYIQTNSKHSHFESKSHQEFDKCKHIILPHEDIDMKIIDEAFYLYIIEHKKNRLLSREM